MAAALLGLLLLAPAADPATPAKPASVKEALQPFHLLVGSWKGTGYPHATSAEGAARSWTEIITWTWHFKDQDTWLEAAFEKSKNFSKWELRYNIEKQTYQLTVTGVDKTTQKFTGTRNDKVLTLERADAPAGRDERLVISLLHHNRYLYRIETRTAGSPLGFVKQYQVGATKQGVPFAEVAKGPECIVSGGVGTLKVTYKGKDYPVCCTGCRDAFKENPEKFIAEAEKAKSKK